MNDKHYRPTTDRKNVLHVFAKRAKSQGDVRAVPDCKQNSNHAKKAAQCGSTCKVKRLKTHTERCRMRGERRQDVHPPCGYQRRSENKMGYSCGCNYNCSLHPQPKRNMNTVVDHEPEPCIITNGRLIGHRGLFNREVKSVDIERLVGEKKRTKRNVAAGGHDWGSKKCSAVALNSCPSLSPVSFVADIPPSNIPEEVWLQDEAKRRQTGESARLDVDYTYRAKLRTQTSEESLENGVNSKSSVQVHVGNTTSDVFHSNGNGNNVTTSCATPLQSAVHFQGVCPYNSEPEPLSSSAGSRGQSVSQRGKPQTPKGDRDSPGSVAVDRPVEQHADTEAREHGGVCKKQESKNCRTLQFCAQSCKPDLSLSESTTATGVRSCEGMEDRLLSWADDCATVAARLCSALQLPLLCRRNLLGESKEALLLTLQKTHGSQLTENLLKLEQQVTEFHSADLRKDNDSETQSGTYKENMASWEQPKSSAGRTACSQRRRKQLLPQKVDVHLPEPQHTDMAFQWNQSMIVDLTEDPSKEFFQTNSPPLVIDFLPSPSSPANTFLSSAWGVQERQPITQNESFWNRSDRGLVAGEHIPYSGYSPEMWSFSQAKNLDNDKSRQYSSFQVEGSSGDVALWPQRPTGSKRTFTASSPPPVFHPFGRIRLKAYSSLHQPPPSPWSGSSNKISHPHTYFPERAISPQLPLRPPCLSPDVWFFPRMRLY